MMQILKFLSIAMFSMQIGCSCEKLIPCNDGNKVVFRSQKCLDEFYLTIATERQNTFKGAIDILDKIKIMNVDIQTNKKIIALRQTLDMQRSGSQDIIKGVIFAYNGSCDAEVRKRYFDVMDKLAADNSSASQIKNELEPALDKPETIKGVFNKSYNNFSKKRVDASEEAILLLQSEPPTNNIMLQAFWAFEFDKNIETSSEEAKKMLQYLGAVEIQRGTSCIDCYVGKLLSNYHVIIWQGTYGKKDTYGIRYGMKKGNDFPFITNNETYIELEK